MRFAIGYQLPGDYGSIVDVVAAYPGAVAEVYFALPAEASGRAPLGLDDVWSVDDAWNAMGSDLSELAGMGVQAVLLLNSSCYGAEAMSFALEERVRRGVALVEQFVPLSAVTTTSLAIARQFKREFPRIEVRASVNMRVGSVAAMAHLADSFDGYYLKRELNRSPSQITALKAWCDAHGKSLHLLANSGCLYDCAYQTFHDNLVAHEAEARQQPGRPLAYPAPCWEFLEKPERWPWLLRNCWIRPEDIHHYEAWFSTVKLATRVHPRPQKVLGAYVRGRYHGNVLDLLEPGHSALPGMPYLDNSRFPADWYERTADCGHDCELCGTCAEVFRLISSEGGASNGGG
ncbi:hypothetical protein [Oligosphaera ethanolica]|uniref:Collagenase-like PrtC family protease n=1 Tax=Oligosphaera ethanolica TaxID=760260 RepID=A0AAE3VD97_9BACT|nr:hypothetical protein [Oligosphaera ethanolica]MDQ0288397.1 collagenase-like PrtC family protease [Oligosphaera ethanolica]